MVQVACFGEVLWDIFELPSGLLQRELGGAPANVAVDLARLGIRAAILGAVGKDRFGEDLARLMKHEGVDIQHLVRRPERTGITFVSRDHHGEPSFLFYRKDTADMKLEAESVPARIRGLRYGVVGTSTLVQPRLLRATYAFCDAVERSGGALVVDLNVRAHLWKDKETMLAAITKLLKRAALVKASEADLKNLVGLRGENWLLDHGPTFQVITRGPKSATARGPFGEVSAPAKTVTVKDATGAGDAFLSGVLATLCGIDGSLCDVNRRQWEKALGIGHAMAAMCVRGVGAVSGIRVSESLRRKVASPT